MVLRLHKVTYIGCFWLPAAAVWGWGVPHTNISRLHRFYGVVAGGELARAATEQKNVRWVLLWAELQY